MSQSNTSNASTPSVDDPVLNHSNEIKAKANDAFKTNKYHDAETFYTEALNILLEARDKEMEHLNESLKLETYTISIAVLYSNRSFTRLKLEEYGFAITDASKAIELDPKYVKAYYRRACAYYSLGKYKDALKDFKTVAKVTPADKEAQAKYKECEKRVKEAAFADAIGIDDLKISLCDTIDLDFYQIDDKYTGPHIPLSKRNEDGTIFPGSLTIDHVKELIEAFKAQKKLHIKYALSLIIRAKQILDGLSTVVDLEVKEDAHITVCGDTHGQFYDLCHIFELNGFPSKENPYLFNGDFVDRGSFSVEVMLTLIAFKVLDPACMHLTRGNHESISMNKIYGFEGEVKAKYTERTFQIFTEFFHALPLAYVLDGTQAGGKRALVLHGGLFGRDGVTLDEMRKVNRYNEPDSGLMSEMLWSDPQKESGWGPSKRGIGVAFGPDVTKRFLENNNLDLLIRSHEMKEEGYEVEADGKLITIFSAPNYVDNMGNKGAFIRLEKDMSPKFIQFEAVPHPDIRPMAYASNRGMLGF